MHVNVKGLILNAGYRLLYCCLMSNVKSGSWSKSPVLNNLLSDLLHLSANSIGLVWAMSFAPVVFQWLISATGINLKYDFLLNLTLSGHFMNVAMKASIFSLALNVPRESRCTPDSFLQKDIEVKNELMESDSSHAMSLWSLNTAVYTPTPRANCFYWPLCFLVRQTCLMSRKPFPCTRYSWANPNECLKHLMGLLNNYLSVLCFGV